MADLSAQDIFSMRGRRAVITGGGSGLGRNIARGFLANDAESICIVDVVPERLVEVRKELEDLARDLGKACSIQTVQADLSSEEGIKRAILEIQNTHDDVDSLVLCAGIRKMPTKTYTLGEPLSKLEASMQSLDYGDMEASFRVNVFAPYYLVAGLISRMGAAAAKGDGRGNIILFSSVAAQHYGQFAPAYQTSKAAIDHMVKIMAAEFAEFYVRVNAISPGLFPSAMNPTNPNDPNYNNMKYDKEMPARRAGLEKEMVGTSLYLASAAGAYVDGENIRVDGGRLLVMSGSITKK